LIATQAELIPQGVADAEVAEFLGVLAAHGWQTRRQLGDRLGWSDRQIRDVAERAGAQVVRGQLGFKLVAQVTRDDLPVAVEAAQAAIAQGKKMIRYGLRLKRRLHEVVG
jgi:hypothetical protein